MAISNEPITTIREQIGIGKIRSLYLGGNLSKMKNWDRSGNYRHEEMWKATPNPTRLNWNFYSFLEYIFIKM